MAPVEVFIQDPRPSILQELLTVAHHVGSQAPNVNMDSTHAFDRTIEMEGCKNRIIACQSKWQSPCIFVAILNVQTEYASLGVVKYILVVSTECHRTVTRTGHAATHPEEQRQRS